MITHNLRSARAFVLSAIGFIAFGGLMTACGGGGSKIPSLGQNPTTGQGPANAQRLTAPDTNGNDWPEFRRDDQRTGSNPYQTVITTSNVATLKPKWTNTTGGVFANAVVMNGIVYQGDLSGNMYAWNLSSGAQIWKFLSPGLGDSFQSSAAFYHGTLYVGNYGLTGRNADYYALNATSGHVNWHYQIPNGDNNASFQGSPLVANGLVYQGEAVQNEAPGMCLTTHQLVAFSLYSPTVVSSLNLTPPGVNGDDIWSSPVLDTSGNVYVATGNRCSPNPNVPTPYAVALLKVRTVGLSGGSQLGVTWAFQPHNSTGEDVDFGSTPLFVNNMLIQGGKDEYVYAVDPNSGHLIWQKNVGVVIGSPATDGSKVYVPVVQNVFPTCGAQGTVCGALVALNLADGSIAWSVPVHTDHFGNADLSAPVVSQGVVYDAFDGGVWGFDASNGNVLWNYPTGHVMYAGLTIVNGGLLVGNFDGSAYFNFTPNGQ